MQYRADSLGLSGQVTTIFRDLIHEHLGLMYEPHQFDQLADRLAPLVVERGLSSFMDYYYLLKYSVEPGEWLKVMDALAVQETYFWREIDQLRAVVTDVVPRLVRTLNGEPLRIWSIPCATGEEPLTIAMLLAEAGWFDRVPIELRGSDASPSAIARAGKARYTQRSFRNLPAAMLDKYFIAHEGYWSAAPALVRRVSYDVVNLMAEDQVARYASAPIIFCRNVFIYFSDRSIRRALGVFERSMPSPGYLCVAASESLLRRTAVFELQEIGGAFMYVKTVPAEQHRACAPGVEKAS
jgi:chemotaxis protein methyltransferase CheR